MIYSNKLNVNNSCNVFINTFTKYFHKYICKSCYDRDSRLYIHTHTYAFVFLSVLEVSAKIPGSISRTINFRLRSNNVATSYIQCFPFGATSRSSTREILSHVEGCVFIASSDSLGYAIRCRSSGESQGTATMAGAGPGASGSGTSRRGHRHRTEATVVRRFRRATIRTVSFRTRFLHFPPCIFSWCLGTL